MKRSIAIAVMLTVFLPCSGLSAWDEYHMIEENSPAYMDRDGARIIPCCNVAGPGVYTDHTLDDAVYCVRTDGSRVYATRRDALKRGWKFYEIGSGAAYYGTGIPSAGFSSGYSGVGKNFYPNSNYKREIKATRRKGFLTTILEVLL
jgi:hypothetical protein